MKINVPVIASKDVLIIGGSLKAVKTALELRASGLTVFMATPYSYFGEDLCATLDLQSPKSDEFKALFNTDKMLVPSEIKRRLDKLVIDAGIDFLFQLRPVRPSYGKNRRVCGALFADRSGFHAVAAKVVVDATERATFARSAGIPTKAFKPGSFTLKMFAIGGVNSESKNLKVTCLPESVAKPDREYTAYAVEMQAELKGNSVFDLAKAVTDFRKAAWTGTGVAYADQIIYDLDDGVAEDYAASSDMPVFIASRCTSGDVARLAGALPTPAPVGFNETPVAHPFEIVRKDSFFRFKSCPTLSFDLNSIPVIHDCDVFVAGGGTGGAPATIGAARAGMRTLCAENLGSLGGVMLVGRIGSYYYGNRVGFTHEIDTGIQNMAPDPDFSIEKGGMNVVWKNEWFIEKATEKGAEILFDTLTAAAVMDGKKACGAVILSPFGIGVVKSSFVIDATGNTDFIAASGAETACDMKSEAAVQGAGLSPIDIGNSYTNTDFTFILDSDVVDATRAFVTAHAKYTKWFDVSTILNTRERRRIVGDIVLQPYDFFANRIYTDTINLAMSNFDTHGFIIHPMFMIRPTAHDSRFANVPMRALLPRGYEGMAATGLGVSAHRDCMPLIRMQPDVQNQGYAMGYAAAMAIKANCPIRAIDMKALQKKLIAESILPERVLTDTDVACTNLENDKFHDISRVFMNPAAAVGELKEKLAANPGDVETAMTLAFLGHDTGRKLLVDTIASTAWDAGWNYTGMGQFGPSMSPLDAMIVALSTLGGDEGTTLDKLSSLSIEMEFSHIRAVSLTLMHNPISSAAQGLERLLAMPGATGYAVVTLQDALNSNRPDYNDTTFRNAQLKEVYLAKALAACSPFSQTARTILNAYARGMQGLYAIFAGA